MNNSFHNVIFDIGNVLLRWDPAGVIAEQFSPDTAEKLKSAESAIHDHWHDLDRGVLTRDEAINLFAELAEIPLKLMREVYYALKNSLYLNAGTYDLLMGLSENGFPLFCISNMSLDFWEYLKIRYSFWSVFSAIIISAEVRLIKPDKAIFRHAFDRFGIEPEHSIFIDDSPLNIAAADELGLKGILFRDAGSCRRQLEEITGVQLSRNSVAH